MAKLELQAAHWRSVQSHQTLTRIDIAHLVVDLFFQAGVLSTFPTLPYLGNSFSSSGLCPQRIPSFYRGESLYANGVISRVCHEETLQRGT